MSILTGEFILVHAQERIPDREKYNWKEFQNNSSVVMDSINYDLLQGNWISYEGIHIGDYKIAWQSNSKSRSLQIKGDKYRNTLSGDFYPFMIDKNLILFQGEGSKKDSAYINLITDKELRLSIKRGIDFDQIHYKK